MWPALDPETRAWRDRCRAFAEAEIAPRAERYDRENRFPDEVHTAGRAAGLIDADLPADLGGGGISGIAAAVGVEALASACAPSAFTLGFNRGALQPVLSAG